MSENETPDTEPEAKAVRARKKTSTADAADKEPTQDSADPAASAEPAVVPSAPNAAVGGTAVDSIRYSAAKPTPKNGPRKSLTVYHVARRLYEHGHTEAWSEGIYGNLTRASVSNWQAERGDEPTGILTRKQFEDLFKGDPNVEVVLDTIGDHPVE